MACRCGEISLCNADIRILSNAQSKASNLFSDVNATQNQLNILISCSSNAYKADNNADICAAIDNLNDDIGPALSGLLSAISSKKSELSAKVTCMTNEDRTHHYNEEMKRLAELRRIEMEKMKAASLKNGKG